MVIIWLKSQNGSIILTTKNNVVNGTMFLCSEIVAKRKSWPSFVCLFCVTGLFEGLNENYPNNAECM